MKVHSDLVGLVGNYITDFRNDLLIHDKNAIMDNTPFIHCTRESGTHIYMLKMRIAILKNLRKLIIFSVKMLIG